MIDFYELTNSSEDLDILKSFYNEIYVFEFPDVNERESLENMQSYLDLKAHDWFGKNNYHIIVALKEGIPIGGSVIDFLADANAGVIEFIFILPQIRHQGIGTDLLKFIEDLLMTDAKKNLGRDLNCIVAEMNDPFQLNEVQDNLEPAKRAMIWNRWEYRILDFPYVQPALSDSQKPVFNLLLITKIFKEDWQQAIPSYQVKLIIHEYLRWAMRFEEPGSCPNYQDMAAFLDARQEVQTLHLGSYVGNNPAKRLSISQINNEIDEDFWSVISVYKDAFSQGPLAIQPQDFIQALHSTQNPNFKYIYHLWAIRAKATAKISGMASFYTLPSAGFGGYIVFDQSLRGTGRLRELVARMELQMLHDQPNTKGWYIETEMEEDGCHFLRLGFRELDVVYSQPPQLGYQFDSRVRLLYKPYGRVYGEAKVTCDEFLIAMEQIFQIVYEIEAPQSHPCYAKLKVCVNSFQDNQMRFR